MPEAVYYVNGDFCGAADAKISILDRGVLFGDAVYEVLRVQNGRLFRAGDHFDRMRRCLDTLSIPVPWPAEGFEGLCGELARRNGVQMGMLYLHVSRGVAERSHVIPQGLTPTVLGFARSADLPHGKRSPAGVGAVTAPDQRWQRCDLKTTMLLANSLARRKAADAGASEAILVSADGIVREGAASNLFAVLGGALRTHPADQRILPGVTRKAVLDLARASGVAVAERAVTASELASAEEVFITGTTIDVCPVVNLDGRPVGDGGIGPVTRRLMALFADTLARETGP